MLEQQSTEGGAVDVMERKIPNWAVLLGAVIIPILTAGVAWGVNKTRVDMIEKKVEKQEAETKQNTYFRLSADGAVKRLEADMKQVRQDVRDILKAVNNGNGSQ